MVFVPPAPPSIAPVRVLASVNVNVSAPVPPVRLPKPLQVRVAVPSPSVPLLLPVIAQAFVVFSPIRVLLAPPPPPLMVPKLLKVRIAVASLELPLYPLTAFEPVSVTAVLTALSRFRALPPALLEVNAVMLAKPPVGLVPPAVVPV